jgi:hypothetical protein
MTSPTLVATFQDYSSAQQAARELETNGIAKDAISVDSNRKTVGAGAVEHPSEEPSESGFMGWWHSLFGLHENTADRLGFEGALESGNAILRVSVTDSMVDMATSILNSNGAIDVEGGNGPRGGVRVYGPLRGGRPTGMSPHTPAPGVLSGGGSTAGAGTLAGESTTGLEDQDFTPEYRKKFEQPYESESKG